MNNKICIVTDTNSGISESLAKKLGVYIVPMPFIIDGEEYYEGKNLDAETFYQKLVNDANIHTSQPSIGSITALWDDILKDYDYIVHLPMSSALSKTCETCEALSHQSEYEGKVFVVDNHRISYTTVYSIIEAKEMIEKGKSAKEIKEFLEATGSDSSIYLMVNTLKYLKKGGRVTPAAAILGSLLGIKPVLQIQGGKLDAFAKCRSVKIAKKTMLNQVKEDIEKRFGDDVVITLVHSYAQGEIETFLEEAKAMFKNVNEEINVLSFSVTCHTGPGVLAITCCKKHNFD